MSDNRSYGFLTIDNCRELENRARSSDYVDNVHLDDEPDGADRRRRRVVALHRASQRSSVYSSPDNGVQSKQIDRRSETSCDDVDGHGHEEFSSRHNAEAQY